MREFIIDFFKAQNYPEDAAYYLLDSYDRMMKSEEIVALFNKHLGEYEKSDRTNFGEFIVLCARAGDSVNINGWTAQFICFVCAAKHLKEMYIKNGLPLDIYSASMHDLRYKLMECKKLHGVWGSFVASWFCRFFTLERFQIGRLQYEFCTHFATDHVYSACGLELVKNETPIINLHIPSSGPLTHDEVRISYQMAYKFFKEYYPERLSDGKLIIECESWLLNPDHYKFLPESSNILKFQRDFELTSSRHDEEFGDCWRIFNKSWDGDAAALSRDTSLQRLYADWLAGGNSARIGYGIIIFDGENIVNKK